MTKTIIIIIFLLVFKTNAAQDTIYLKNGQVISAQILKVNFNSVEYQLFNYSKGPLFKKYINAIHFIKYQNNTIDVFNQDSSEITITNIYQSTTISLSEVEINDLNSEDLDSLARRDANLYYNTKNLGTNVFFTSFLFGPVIGCFSAAIIKGQTPSESNLNMPIKPTLNSEIYKTAYKQEASKLKKEKVNRNNVVGSLLSLIVTAIYLYIR